MLLVDLSSVFNTIIPDIPTIKLDSPYHRLLDQRFQLQSVNRLTTPLLW